MLSLFAQRERLFLEQRIDNDRNVIICSGRLKKTPAMANQSHCYNRMLGIIANKSEPVNVTNCRGKSKVSDQRSDDVNYNYFIVDKKQRSASAYLY